MKKIMMLALLCMQYTFGSFNCTVDVDRVLVYANGSVNVKHSGRNNYTIICNLKRDRQGVSIPTCAIWTSLLLNLHKDGEKAIFYYRTTDSYNSCAQLPIYGSSPAPVYIGDT